eukprot:7060087-Lingulodinium_polyedra.AAC.1
MLCEGRGLFHSRRGVGVAGAIAPGPPRPLLPAAPGVRGRSATPQTTPQYRWLRTCRLHALGGGCGAH